MEPVSIWDLKDKDHPAVLKGLERKCGLCGADKGDYCHALSEGHNLTYLVHFERATHHWDARKKTA